MQPKHASTRIGPLLGLLALAACANNPSAVAPTPPNTASAQPSAAASQVPPTPTLHSGFAPLGTGALYYVDTGGTGPVVMFLHAGSGNSAVWEYQFAAFAQAGYRMIAFDRIGHGQSPKQTPTPSSIEQIEAVAQTLKLQKFHLLGVAAGGGVALRYVINRPERVQSLVVASSVGDVQDASYLELSKRLRPKAFFDLPVELKELGPSYRAAEPEGVARWLSLSEHDSGVRKPSAEQPPAAVGTPQPGGAPAASAQTAGSAPLSPLPSAGPAASNAERKVSFAALHEIRVPTLLLTGDADLYAPPAVLRLFKAHLVQAEVQIIAEAGHAPHWETPALFNSHVLSFLARAQQAPKKL